MSLLRLEHIGRTYDMGHVQVQALHDVSMSVERGEMVAILGPSGSGKTTMMSIIGCLDRPTHGRYELDGTDVGSLNDGALARIRSRTIGFVFQSYNLLPGTSAVDNVATPLLYQGVPRRERVKRATIELERLGLGHRLRHEPTELSGGEQQRVALARALVTQPALLLADEPTGNLAVHQGLEVLKLFQDLHAAGHTIVLITHNPEVGAVAQRQVHLLDGVVVDAELAA
ncbi:MAG TPA: ABC transporter ATP-binding protein [Candidatus Dormibacteraeota bacterium]|nr:ABC transporter ATP-binding protein [Candidatus Dormibacteraeota bacterium]